MYNLISLTRSELRGGEGTGDLVNERNVQMSVCKCVCVFQVWLIIMYDLRFHLALMDRCIIARQRIRIVMSLVIRFFLVCFFLPAFFNSQATSICICNEL